MKRATRIALGAAGLAIGIAVAGAAPASAQVGFYGSFPVPFGRITVGVPGPGLAIGAFVPPGFVVVNDPYYGYGFAYGDQWIACRPYGGRWIVAESRPYVGRYGYGRGYAHGGPAWHSGSRYERGYVGRGEHFGSRGFENGRGSRNEHRSERRADQRMTRQGRGSDSGRRGNR
jgi:hypothetical protein